MATQQSKRGLQVTQANFEQAFETFVTRFGYKGVNINDAIDALEPDELSRMLNISHRVDGSVSSRAGQTSLSTAGTNHHSMRRLNDPANSTWTRFHGIDTAIYRGQSGALTSTETGFSGDPVTFVPYRVPLSGATWMFAADRTKMRKFTPSGTSRAIGLPKPTNAPTFGEFGGDIYQIRPFCSFEDGGGDGDNSSSDDWDADAVFPLSATAPTVTDSGSDGIFVEFPAVNFSNGQASQYILAIDRAHDLSTIEIGGGPTTVPASDADLVRFYVACNNYRLLDNFTVQFVVDTADGTFNQATIADGTDIVTKGFQRRFAPEELEPTFIITRFGDLGKPLYRGEFEPFGGAVETDWATIVGLVIQVSVNGNVDGDFMGMVFQELYLKGGGGPDSTDPALAPYDWKYTHYDPTTGAESNGSAVSSPSYDGAQRQTIQVSVDTYGDSDIRQRVYRRGGTLPDDWYFVGVNTSDGGQFDDNKGDDELSTSITVPTGHFQPVPTVNASGTTVLAQAVPALWGPVEDFLFACGDPYRPGHVYFCQRGEPDHWPDDYHTEVCSSSEELMHGDVFGGQAFVFSKERMYYLYPNLSGEDATITSLPSQCKRGMVNRWGLAVGLGGIYFIARDGIYRTVGGPEEWLSKKLDPLFRGKTVNGYAPIDWSATTLLRLAVHENELYFQYKDTNGALMVAVFNIPYGYWRPYQFGKAPSCLYSDEGNATSTLLIGGLTTGKTYTHTGTSDDSTAIGASLRTGSLNFGVPRQEKRFGDQYVDIDTKGISTSLINYVDEETITNSTVTLTAATGRKRLVIDGFGDTPQRGRTLAANLSWSTTAAAPILYALGTAAVAEPEITINRVTQWDDLGHPDESYLTGVTFDCDTFGVAREVFVEVDYNGAVSTVATLTVNSNGRHKLKFSWTAAQAHKVRLRPSDDTLTWLLFKCDWISQPEPPRIAKWDTNFENAWDQYYTGVDLYCDTGGLDKTVNVYIDGGLAGTFTINANGRKVKHITLQAGRGHTFRIAATDSNPGILYDVRWHLDPEPSGQANWNQNYTIAGTESDKYLKAIVFQCDTFGQDKTVTVDVDGSVVETLTINTTGRKVIQKSFSQHLGRVFRIYPTDCNASRLYSVQWVFDQEPLALDRWETQEITHGLAGWSYPINAHVTLKSSASVNLAVTAYNQSGTATTNNYTISSTSNAKIKVYVPFVAGKGIMYKYVLTSASPFWLYKEETAVYVREWGTDNTAVIRPFGNDDSVGRNMSNSALTAARSGGNIDG